MKAKTKVSLLIISFLFIVSGAGVLYYYNYQIEFVENSKIPTVESDPTTMTYGEGKIVQI